jgi:hypothetical protein
MTKATQARSNGCGNRGEFMGEMMIAREAARQSLQRRSKGGGVEN